MLTTTYRTAVLSELKTITLFNELQFSKKGLLEILSTKKFPYQFPTQTKLHFKISVFNTWLSFSSDQHNYETSSSTQGNLIKLFYRQKDMGSRYSITASALMKQNPKTITR